MPAPIESGLRLEIIRRHEQGESLRDIREALRRRSRKWSHHSPHAELAIGRAFRAQTVTVRLDPAAACWLVQDRDGLLLKPLPASPLDYPTIPSVHLTFRHVKASRRAKLVDASPGAIPTAHDTPVVPTPGAVA